MSVIDKSGILNTLSREHPITIELGCGNWKRLAGAVGVDALDYPAVDIVGDVYNVLSSFPDACVEECYSSHLFEHLPDLPAVMKELGRVVAPGGRVVIVVPHFSNPYFYSDYTHTRFFGLYSLSYLCRDQIFARRVPSYQLEPIFDLIAVNLVFKSSRASGLRRISKRVASRIFNSSNAMKELYEESFCWLMPCYEVQFTLRRQK